MSEPIVDLAYAILLVAVKKSIEAFRIRPDAAEYVLEHLVEGDAAEEMRAPRATLAAVIRRMSVMANLPAYRKGEVAIGRIHLLAGEVQYYFAIQVSGHGPDLALNGRVLSKAEYHAG